MDSDFEDNLRQDMIDEWSITHFTSAVCPGLMSEEERLFTKAFEESTGRRMGNMISRYSIDIPTDDYDVTGSIEISLSHVYCPIIRLIRVLGWFVWRGEDKRLRDFENYSTAL